MGRRIRSIKPEIIEDEKTANLGHLEWRLFVSLWLLADDYGNLRGDPNYVRGAVLWARDEGTEVVAAALAELDRLGLIQFYRVRGQLYVRIVGWGKHQKVDKPGKPQMPGPEEQDPQPPAMNSRESRESSREARESLAPDRDQDQRPGAGEEGEGSLASEAEILPLKASRGLTERSEGTRPELQDKQRRRLRTEKWRELDRLRQTIATELGVTQPRPLPTQDPGERALAMRILEAESIERATADIDHVLAVYAAEARTQRTVQWLTGAMFEERCWRRALGMTLADASREPTTRKGPARAEEAPRRIRTL